MTNQPDVWMHPEDDRWPRLTVSLPRTLFDCRITPVRKCSILRSDIVRRNEDDAENDYSFVRTGGCRPGSANRGVRSRRWWRRSRRRRRWSRRRLWRRFPRRWRRWLSRWWLWRGGFRGGGFHGGFAAGGFHGGRFHRRAFVGFGFGPYYDGYYPYAYDDSYYGDGGCYVVRRRVHTRHGWRIRPVQVCG